MVFPTLKILFVTFLLHVFTLQPRLNGLVLVVEICEVWNQVLHNIGVWQRLDFNGLRTRLNVKKTSKAIFAIDIHGTRSANSFTARTPESECRINLIFDLDESIQDHGAALLQIYGVLL